jgi:tetratricopeptide (TPR) repeat protein
MGSSSFEVSELEFLRDQLVAAEHCKRKGEIPEVLHAYDSLATYCREKNDIPTMIFFYDKCLEIARLVGDQMSEMRVLHKIGTGYHTLRDLERAREYHEQYVAIAQVVYEHEDDDELRGDAYRDLGKVYVDLAVQHELTKQFQSAIDLYKQYLDCASKAGDKDYIAHAQYKIGACYNALSQPANALPFLEAYVRIFLLP